MAGDKDDGGGFDLAILDTLALTRTLPTSEGYSALRMRGELGGDEEIGEA